MVFPDNKSVVAMTWNFHQLNSSFCWWDATNGKILRTVWPADEPQGRLFADVLAGAVTPDGKIAAARIGGYYLPREGGKPVPRYSVKWWEVDSGRELASIPCNDLNSVYFALAHDGSTAVTAKRNGPGAVKVLDRATRKQTAAFDAKGYVWDLTILPSGKVAALITDDGVVLWDFASGHAPRVVLAKSTAFRPAKLEFSTDGKMLAVAGYPSEVRFLDAANGQLLRSLPAPDWSHSAVTMMAFSSDGKQLALGEMHESSTRVTVWDLASGKPRHTLESPLPFVSHGAFSPDGRLLATVSNNVLDVWNLTTEKRLSAPFVGNSSTVNSIACLARGGTVATTACDDTVRLWEARTGRQKTLIHGRHQVGGGLGFARGLAVSPDGRLLACFAATTNGEVRIWDAETGKQLHELAGHGKLAEVRCLSFSADGKRLAGAGDDGKARVWSVEKETLLGESELQVGLTSRPSDRMAEMMMEAKLSTFLQRTAFFPDLDCIVVNGSMGKSGEPGSNMFHVLSVDTGKELRTFGDNKLTKFGMALSPDGKQLLSEEYHVANYKIEKRELCLWDVAAATEMWRTDLPLRSNGRITLAVSSNGKRFAAAVGGDPNEIWLCEMATGKVLRTFQCDSRAMCVSFSADGSLLAAGMSDGTTLTWDVSR